ncbi:RNA polymerase sigma-70 factor [Dawidia soli]|uniref:RNA polymerase sigma-70 factor n=1 Tax=Dawidia soli TaxID=2782352 RepID=A0AAP2DFY3_9BACT|nr:RNA polymerase sigma-70 factor [Dawidia soli]MBT1688617.1 RNA polymerase sigma-70 factor [Dawidia soli]
MALLPHFNPAQAIRYSTGIAALRPQNEGLDLLFDRVAREDDYKSFETIFKRMYRQLCRVSARMVQSHALAEEIVDDVFCNLWGNRKRIQINSSFQAYLLASVRNKSLDCLRKTKHDRNIELECAADVASVHEGAQEHLVYEELRGQIESAIESLPKQCRTIFRMSREQDMKYKDIADVLQISIKTVDTQMGRALKHLRQAVRPVSV